ncbi:acetylcholinesterase [Aureococcus anophagefferens]|nr:acetylcholinesterase [Aureococcus anophagefferens]
MARSLNREADRASGRWRRARWWAWWAASAGAWDPRRLAAGAPAATRAFQYVFAHWSEANCDAAVDLAVEAERPRDTPLDAPLPFACHGADVQFTFGNEAGPDGLSSDSPTPRHDCPYSQSGRRLSDAGDADGGWRPGGGVRKLASDDDGGIATVDRFRAADCAFWASVDDEVAAALAVNWRQRAW